MSVPALENAANPAHWNERIPYRLVHSPREAEILLGISHAHLYRLIRNGRLVAVKIGGRTGITRGSIEALAARE
jgi:excisionase family DNA binding protein